MFSKAPKQAPKAAAKRKRARPKAGKGKATSGRKAAAQPQGSRGSGGAAPAAAPLQLHSGAGGLGTFSAAHNESLLWGTYRPGVYFGLRSRTAPVAVVGAAPSRPEGQAGRLNWLHR